jgi:hypothetical protein
MLSLVDRVLKNFKPEFKINSLDLQNNNSLKNDHTDSTKTQGATDYKPLPGATFSGSVGAIPRLDPNMSDMIIKQMLNRNPLERERQFYRPNLVERIKKSMEIKHK